jgi:carbamoyltransferase
MNVLGISCYYHDSAAALVDDHTIKFAIQEERLSRVKHDARFPALAIGRALESAKLRVNALDAIVFYEDPQKKLRRLWDQAIDGWPDSRRLFFEDIPYFYQHKFPIREQLRKHLGYKGKVEFSDHHTSHAASAFFTSPFERAIVVTLDGVGEYDTAAVHIGEGNRLRKLRSIRFPHSLGLLYSVFTDYLGFEVNEGEYKVMGLAPYGKPLYRDKILGPIIQLREDGSFTLDPVFFEFCRKERHYSDKLERHLGIPPRLPETSMTQDHMDLAASVQSVLEAALVAMIAPLAAEFDTLDFCFAGGVALNCTANSELIRRLGIRSHIHPAAGDAGGALGAALNAVVRSHADGPTKRFPFSAYLGIEYPEAVAKATFTINSIVFDKCENVTREIARQLANGKVVAIVNGRDEWGPRALGARSILADPRSALMKDHVNAKIKFREEFRPFAPVIKKEHYGEYFESLGMDETPFMLFTHRSLRPDDVAAVVHVDGTSRVQTVSQVQNPYLYAIIDEFHQITGVPVLLNTSFNLRGEPIVSSPSDALRTFENSGIDCLIIGDLMVNKQHTSDASLIAKQPSSGVC